MSLVGELLPSSATYTKERRWTSEANIQNYHIQDKKAGEIQPSLDTPARHAYLCQKRGRGTRSKSFQGRWACIGLMTNFFLIESPKSWKCLILINSCDNNSKYTGFSQEENVYGFYFRSWRLQTAFLLGWQLSWSEENSKSSEVHQYKRGVNQNHKSEAELPVTSFLFWNHTHWAS